MPRVTNDWFSFKQDLVVGSKRTLRPDCDNEEAIIVIVM